MADYHRSGCLGAVRLHALAGLPLLDPPPVELDEVGQLDERLVAGVVGHVDVDVLADPALAAAAVDQVDDTGAVLAEGLRPVEQGRGGLPPGLLLAQPPERLLRAGKCLDEGAGGLPDGVAEVLAAAANELPPDAGLPARAGALGAGGAAQLGRDADLGFAADHEGAAGGDAAGVVLGLLVLDDLAGHGL